MPLSDWHGLTLKNWLDELDLDLGSSSSDEKKLVPGGKATVKGRQSLGLQQELKEQAGRHSDRPRSTGNLRTP